MKDFLGNDLSLGDEVVFPQPHYRNLIKGVVVGFTTQKVRIKFTQFKGIGPNGYSKEYLIEPELNVIKI